MAREGISPAGRAGFEDDITQEQVEALLTGFLDSLVNEIRETATHAPALKGSA